MNSCSRVGQKDCSFIRVRGAAVGERSGIIFAEGLQKTVKVEHIRLSDDFM